MDIHHLKYYIAVVESKNFTKAAERLQVTQPMLTRIVQQLEEELCVKLIDRTSKRFYLTDAGELFYREAKEVLAHFSELYRNIDDVKSGNAGNVRVSIPGVLLDTYFPQLLMNFRRLYPNINISIVEEGSKLTTQSVLSGQSDLGLVMLPVSHLSHFCVTRLVQDVCQLMVPKGHPLTRYTCVPLQMLREEPIITFSDTSTLHDEFINLCEREGFSPNIIYKSFMPNFTFDMVSLGLCVAVLPAPIIKRYMTEDFVALPLVPTVKWDIAVITKKNQYQSFSTRKLVKHIEKYFEENA
ncbi:MAG: LysR family transcriptional regulator [Lachnospiraceae bacterium]|nr:LysR family transcriptional regulator [Lachnospiraceae bacterium]